jgi:hypothetical protein
MAIMGAISFLSMFVELPRINFGPAESIRQEVRLFPPVAPSNEPLEPPHQVVPVDSATAKSCTAPNVSQPENAFAGIVGLPPMPKVVGLIENSSTTDSVSAIVGQQLAPNLLGSLQIPTLTSSGGSTEPSSAFAAVSGVYFPPSSSVNLTEAEKKSLGLTNAYKPLTWEELQRQAESSPSISPTGQQVTLSGVQQPTQVLLGVQQPNFSSQSLWPDAKPTPQTPNAVEH